MAQFYRRIGVGEERAEADRAAGEESGAGRTGLQEWGAVWSSSRGASSRPSPTRRPRPSRPGLWTWSPNGAAEAEPGRARRFMRRVQLPLAVVVVVWAGLPGGARSPSPGAETEAAVTGRTGAWLFWLRACPRRGDSRAHPLPDAVAMPQQPVASRNAHARRRRKEHLGTRQAACRAVPSPRGRRRGDRRRPASRRPTT